MADDKKSTIKWDLIIDTLIDNKCVLLLGPDAVEYEPGKPINKLVDNKLPEELPEGVHYHAPDGFFMFTDEKSRIEAYYKIKKIYKDAWNNPDFYSRTMYRQLARLPFTLYLSVNPDQFLSRAFEELGIDHSFETYIKKQKAGELANPQVEKPLIYNIMGNIEKKESLVLSHDDMFAYLHSILGVYELPTELQNMLKEADSFIFLGFRFQKWYMQLILRLLNMYFKTDKYQYAFAEHIQKDVHSFFVDEFNIEFVDEDEQGFVDELYKRCEEEAILREEKSSGAGEALSTSQAISKLINEDELSEAINKMKAFFEAHDQELVNDIVLIASKYNRLQKKITRGIITEDNAGVEQNKIAAALNDMLEDVQEYENA